MPAGTRLTPARIGALAAAGVAEVACGSRPRAAVLSTGTELRPRARRSAPGQIYEANSFMLAAALASAGAEVERLPVAADDEAVHREALERALEADVVVTSGGVSVGPHDLVRGIEAELGVEEVFWGVAVKPGKPVSFGVRGRTLVFGLPGNPVSTLAGFELFVRPALLKLQGAGEPRPALPASAASRAPVRRNPVRDQLVRARSRVEDDGVVLDPVTGQESHMIVRAAGADSLALDPARRGRARSGRARPVPAALARERADVVFARGGAGSRARRARRGARRSGAARAAAARRRRGKARTGARRGRRPGRPRRSRRARRGRAAARRSRP